VPELLDSMPERAPRSKLDFSQWADGQAWKFVRGEDYDSSTATFRSNLRRWARDNGFQIELRPYPALDDAGCEIPLTKADATAVGVRFVAKGD
jgi:hypothetical protein